MTMNLPQPQCCDVNSSRRTFLRNTGLVAGAGVVTSIAGSSFMQAALAQTGSAAAAPNGNVLVVLSMRGGVDGMSLVVPHGDPGYAEARPTIAVPPGALWAKDDTFGLHPKLKPLEPLWNDGKFAAVNACGLQVPNRSHFAAMEEIEDADLGSEERRGWLNRLIGLQDEISPIETMQVGGSIVPTSLYGPSPVLAVTNIKDMVLPGRDGAQEKERRIASLRKVWSADQTALGRGASAALDVSTLFADLAAAPGDPAPGANYPNGDLGRALGDAARIIKARIGAQLITVDTGSWDMHTGIGTTSKGVMTTAIGEFGAALAAFFVDLGADADRVTVVTISEFGRRVQENGNNGLDHGWGNVMMLLGAGVKGGRYYGGWPGLTPDVLVDGDLPVRNDYRDVLSEVIRSRFDVDLSRVFPGFSPTALGTMTSS